MPVHRTDAVPAEARRGQSGVLDSCELHLGVRTEPSSFGRAASALTAEPPRAFPFTHCPSLVLWFRSTLPNLLVSESLLSKAL